MGRGGRSRADSERPGPIDRITPQRILMRLGTIFQENLHVTPNEALPGMSATRKPSGLPKVSGLSLGETSSCQLWISVRGDAGNLFGPALHQTKCLDRRLNRPGNLIVRMSCRDENGFEGGGGEVDA